MTGGLILYESGKYSVILFLFLGIIFGEFKQVFSVQYIFYILLLLFGIVFTEVPEGEFIRNAISFNLSGPIVLGVAAFYFYKRAITKQQLLDAEKRREQLRIEGEKRREQQRIEKAKIE
jgi:hypothetical protein